MAFFHVQTKPKQPGRPMRAVQFLGDPSIHKDVYQSNYPHPHYRLRCPDQLGGSSSINSGDYIVWDELGNMFAVTERDFKMNWQMFDMDIAKVKNVEEIATI